MHKKYDKNSIIKLFEKKNIDVVIEDEYNYLLEDFSLTKENRSLMQQLLQRITRSSLEEIDVLKFQNKYWYYHISFENLKKVDKEYHFPYMYSFFSLFESQVKQEGKMTFDEFLEDIAQHLEGIDTPFRDYFFKGVYTEEKVRKFNLKFHTDYVFKPRTNEFYKTQKHYIKAKESRHI